VAEGKGMALEGTAKKSCIMTQRQREVWFIWVAIMPGTSQKELRPELLNGNCYPGGCFPKQKYNLLASCRRLPSRSKKPSADCRPPVTSRNRSLCSTPTSPFPRGQRASNRPAPARESSGSAATRWAFRPLARGRLFPIFNARRRVPFPPLR